MYGISYVMILYVAAQYILLIKQKDLIFQVLLGSGFQSVLFTPALNLRANKIDLS